MRVGILAEIHLTECDPGRVEGHPGVGEHADPGRQQAVPRALRHKDEERKEISKALRRTQVLMAYATDRYRTSICA